MFFGPYFFPRQDKPLSPQVLTSCGRCGFEDQFSTQLLFPTIGVLRNRSVPETGDTAEKRKVYPSLIAIINSQLPDKLTFRIRVIPGKDARWVVRTHDYASLRCPALGH